MKDRKRVMCGGLAFSDCEDMEMLHQYAREGWVFQEFRGMCYILQRQAPVKRIFSYDMQKLKEDEKEAYFQLFENSGWHIINPEGKEIYFFWAEEGNVPLHSEVETRMEGYRSTLHIFTGALVIGSLCLLSLLWVKSSIVSMILLLTGSILGAVGLLMVAGILQRMRKRRLRIVNLTFRKGAVLFVSGVGLLFVSRFVQATDMYNLLLILGTVCTIEGFLWMCFQYRQFRDKKEIQIKKKDEGVL
ncbi:DUF2812 domain-containing protein [[Clostridium] innocuum]|uniref:DUF2812 domain-containing protein n=1 Tax=Clostridium innocuum TaxID=1522 RepID=UPI002147CFC1|nr:DUF2812 domain-containing protein [[Clostridium] innocuum]MCR0201118.1 DUF2812 domain-containing protein [[Clostridium] innocuum]